MKGERVTIRRADVTDAQATSPLMDAYRMFYGQASDVESAGRFLRTRLERQESVVFLAEAGHRPVGFTQLYPLFSTVSLRPIWLLNDLYVAPEARRLGVGTALLKAARSFGAESGAARLWLQTARDNRAAQATYSAQGWQRDETFTSFTLTLD